MLVATPVMTVWVTPWSRRIRSRSVAVKAPQRCLMIRRDRLLRGDAAVVAARGQQHRGAPAGGGGAFLGFAVDVQAPS
jgi:hypothetical protein